MLNDLRKIVQAVNTSESIHEALSIIVERVKRSLSADVCSIYLNDPETHEHVLMASDGLRPTAVGKLRIKYGEGITGLVCQRAEIINLEDAPTNEHFKFFANTGEAPYHGFLGIPIIQRGTTIGVLVVQQRSKRKFSDDEESFLVTLAAQLSGSISLADIKAQLGKHGELLQENLIINGNASSSGIALGEAVVLYSGQSLPKVPDKEIEDSEAEIKRFLAAIEAEKVDLKNVSDQLKDVLGAGDRALFDAYALLLESDHLIEGTINRIQQGNWAPAALRDTISEYADIFEEMEDAYLAGRSADIRDIGLRLLKRLESDYRNDTPYPKKTVIFGEEVGVSELMEVPSDQLVGLVSIRGTSASHVALLARGMGIPAVFGLDEVPLERINGRQVVIDGYAKRVCIQPAGLVLEEYNELIEEESELSSTLEQLKDKESVTLDNQTFSILANAGLTADIRSAKKHGAEGIGLYRTELLFHLRDNFPSEELQTELYKSVISTFPDKPVVLRTLDVGGDKPLSYFPIVEENPFLGWRGIRISLDQVSLFKAQLRAMLKACAAHPDNQEIGIMFPMITSHNEVIKSKKLLREAYNELLEEGYTLTMPQIGVMIEVPSAAFLVNRMAKEVDFFSIGSNDLTQYMLAVDRNNERVADIYDFLHPAVLYAINNCAKNANKNHKPISVCGEMAGDPIGALVLMGMGIRTYSMSIGNLLKTKWVIRSFSVEEAQNFRAQAMRLDDAKDIRAMYEEIIVERGLGGLLRAGKH